VGHPGKGRLLEEAPASSTVPPPSAEAQLAFLAKLQRLFAEGDFTQPTSSRCASRLQTWLWKLERTTAPTLCKYSSTHENSGPKTSYGVRCSARANPEAHWIKGRRARKVAGPSPSSRGEWRRPLGHGGRVVPQGPAVPFKANTRLYLPDRRCNRFPYIQALSEGHA
jgi:hypothetical protein